MPKDQNLATMVNYHLQVLPISCTYGYGNETALRAALKTGYDAESKPDLPTNVTLLYNIRLLKELDITLETLKQAGYIRLLWNDSRLTWDPNQYGNITALSLKWCWRPQFMIANSAIETPYFGDDNDKTSARVYHTGQVTWGVFFYSETICDVNTANFPFDEQTCGLEFGFINDEAYTHLNIILALPEVDSTIMIPHGEWDFVDSYIYSMDVPLCCPQMTSTAVQADMTFKRRQPYYVINIILPMILLSFCVPWVFFIPTESGERLGYSLTMLLSYFVFITVTSEMMPSTSLKIPVLESGERLGYSLTMLLSYFVFITVTSEMMPSTSLKIPVLAKYLLTVLVLCVFALISVAIQVKVYFMETRPNKAARVIFKALRTVVTLDCCKKTRNSTTPVQAVTDDDCKHALPDEEECTPYNSGSTERFQEDITWKCFAVVVDRFLFYVYNIVVGICNMALLVTLYS